MDTIIYFMAFLYAVEMVAKVIRKFRGNATVILIADENWQDVLDALED